MKLHRNSQKRYYIKGAAYFITTNTFQRYSYFEQDILCDFFVRELLLCRKLKRFILHGYKINPDHVHLLLQPGNEFNISEIMKSLKENFTINTNRKRDDVIALSMMPPFKWQKSFHDHIIRNKEDFYKHINYIKKQWIHHGLQENKWVYVAD